MAAIPKLLPENANERRVAFAAIREVLSASAEISGERREALKPVAGCSVWTRGRLRILPLSIPTQRRRKASWKDWELDHVSRHDAIAVSQQIRPLDRGGQGRAAGSDHRRASLRRNFAARRVGSAEAGIIRPVLVGPERKIRDTAAKYGLDISAFEIVDTAHSEEAASKGVELIHAARGEMLMKGSLHTDELMRSVTAKVGGLRTERRISHVSQWTCRPMRKRFSSRTRP